MKPEELKLALEQTKEVAGPSFECDEAALFQSLEQQQRKPGVGIQMITIAGGLLGALAFLGFLFNIKFYEHTYWALAMGVIFLATSLFHSFIIKNKVVEPLTLGLYVVGGFLIGVTLSSININSNNNGILLVFFTIAVATWIWGNGKLLVFMGTCIAFMCAVGFILENKVPNLIHLVTFTSTMISGALFYYEDRLVAMRNRWSEIYGPVRIATLMGGFGTLEFFSSAHWSGFDDRVLWFSSIAPLFWSFVILNPLVQNRQLKILLMVALLVPAIVAPSITISIAVLLFGFGFRNLFILALGVWTLISSTFMFYQSLQMTLLQKSLILMVTGVVFLIALLILNKSLKKNEI